MTKSDVIYTVRVLNFIPGEIMDELDKCYIPDTRAVLFRRDISGKNRSGITGINVPYTAKALMKIMIIFIFSI